MVTRMEQKVEHIDTRLVQTEQGIELLRGDVSTLKCDIATIQSLMTEVLTEMRQAKRPEAIGTRIEESPGSKVTTEYPRTEEQGETEVKEARSDFSNLRKLDMPLFSGEDPLGWIFRIERYFKLNRIIDDDKLDAAVLCFENRALNWFQWCEIRSPLRNWIELKRALVLRFHPSQCGGTYEMLMALRQRGIVVEYIERFELLSATLDKCDDEVLIAAFLNGLHPDIKADLRMIPSHSIRELMDMALRIEERNWVKSSLHGYSVDRAPKLWDTDKWATRPSPTRYTAETSKPTTHTAAISADPKSTRVAEKVEIPVTHITKSVPKKLTDAEIERRRELGLCFKCDEKFRPGHRCKKKQLQVLILAEEADNGENPESDVVTPAIASDNFPDEPATEGQLMTLSLNALAGVTGGKTIKLKGTVLGHSALILIDCGATHSFIHHDLVNALNLTLDPRLSFTVQVGDSRHVQGRGICRDGRGICRDVPIVIQGLHISQHLYPFQLGGSDIILGADWLESLDEVLVSWKRSTLKIDIGGEWVCLRGDPSLQKSEMSSSTLLKSMRSADVGFLIEFTELKVTDINLTEIAADVQGLLGEFPAVQVQPTGLPPHRSVDHTIELKPGEAPPNIRPYRYPHCQKSEIEKMVQDMLQTGLIRPSRSSFSSPVLLVKKKDGSWRFCIDYRALNKITIQDKFPIPAIEELLDELHGAQIFSKLDLKSGYHQIRMKPGEEHKTAFRTHDGHYEFVVMPFELKNAPSTFQSLMNDIFRQYLRKFILVFFDDILVYSVNRQEHLRHLRVALEVLQQHHLVINAEKCIFAQSELEYLGHIISPAGVHADPSKVQSMLTWPVPQSLKELRGFLDLTGYYRRFVRNYGTLASPLTRLLRKNAFHWNEEAQSAFDILKQAMSSTPVLAIPDFQVPFVVEADASGTGLGAVLMQNGRPLAYYSHHLSTKNQQKSVYERELMAIVFAVKKWRYYLLGRPFLIKTDQKPLKYLLEQRVLDGQQQQWVSKLMGFDFQIQYKPGASNSAADGLSRRGGDCALQAISVLQNPDIDSWDQEVRADPTLAAIIQALGTGQDFHDSPIGGHSGYLRTYKRLASLFHWDGMRRDVQKYVAACDTCLKNKHLATSPAGLLQPLPIPDAVWTDITMDFITGLPNLKKPPMNNRIKKMDHHGSCRAIDVKVARAREPNTVMSASN
ncbi:uncharacterized protein LOC114752313 [Neltuma alba]|uniref:uncharacterized protein LOC114752313 n=1 Tax=Neltuma alba TaxID=207710 RepID=UPI0010A57F17|nr:uncharacterized protein LOC114752313 [Prosopis alba]